MDIIDFLTASGGLAWAFIGWRMVRSIRGLKHRLRWALTGPRPSRARRWS
jgi:hypothetical protein